MSIWFTSDTHFNHANILKFGDADGNAIRTGFESVEHMNEVMIERWNHHVKPTDKIYHLGDVAMGDRSLIPGLMQRLNGRKRLIIGNHDDIVQIVEAKVFQKIGLWRMFKDYGFSCTHVPLPPDQFLYKVPLNVHGHIHEKPDPSPHHMNICVERTEYRPVHIDEILERVARIRQEA